MNAHLRIPALLCAAALAVSANDEFVAKAEAYLSAAEKKGNFAGAVLVAQKGKILISKGIGLANFEHDVPNKPNTKFRIGSITKQFTAAAILQLQEQGKLNVQDPISKYVPDSPETWKGVTIHHLLTHTSGIPSYTDTPAYVKGMREKAKPLDFIKRFRDLPLEFEPGSKMKYDNSGYFLLGIIIEQASGKSYETYLKENIFNKADMQDSGYDWDTTILKNRAAGYEGTGKDMRNAAYLDMSQPYAAGSLYSTVEDLYRWDRALNAEKILAKKSLEAMYTPALNNYAYGWSISKSKEGKTVIGHGGGINGFNTMITRIPEEDVCVVVLSNVMPPKSGVIATDLVRLMFGETVRMPGELPKEITLDPKVFDRYAGKYTIAGQPLLFFVKDGKFMTKLGPQPELQIFPMAEDKFFLKVVEAEVTFVTGKDGKATEAVLFQGGGTQTAKRVE